MSKKIQTSNNGFTLSELLVVVAIIALLLILAASVFIRQIAKGNDSRRKADLNRIKIAVEEYEKDHDCYPDASLMVSCGSSLEIAIHPYLSNVPCDPQTKKSYYYEMDTTSSCPKWFRIYSTLENSSDAQYVPNIGPGGIYSYYVSSENSPQIGQGSSGSCVPKYGCINHQCVLLELNSSCQSSCQPYYDGCYGQCEDPTNPAPECLPI